MSKSSPTYTSLHYIIVAVVLLIMAACSGVSQDSTYSSADRKQIDSVLNTVSDTVGLNRCLKDYVASGNKLGEAMTLRRKGRAYRTQNLFAKAIEIHREGLAVADSIGDTLEIVNALNEISNNYRRLGAMYKASSSLSLSLSYCQQWADTSRTAEKCRLVTLTNMGLIFYTVGNYKAASDFYHRALAGEERLNNRYGISVNLVDIGVVMRAEGRRDSAWVYFKRAMEQKQLMEDQVGVSLCHVRFGELYEDEGQYDEAIKEYEQAYLMLVHHNDRWLYLEPCIALAQVYWKRQMTATALEYLQEALQTASDIHSTQHLARIYNLYYEIYHKAGNSEKALKAFVTYKELSDSILNLKQLGDIQNVQVEDLISENSRKLATMRHDMERMHNRQIRTWIGGIVIFAGLCGVVAFIAYLLRVRTRSLEELNDLRAMRTNFYSNISHELRTPITIIQSASESIGQRTTDSATKNDADKVHSASKELMKIIDQIIDITQVNDTAINENRWCHDDVLAYVRMMADGLRYEAAKRQIRIMVQSKRNHIDADFVPDYLDRILLNLLLNSLKFAFEKTDIYLNVSQIRGKLRIEVKDRGPGIPTAAMKSLFNPFSMSQQSQHDVGADLQLTLIRSSVKAMGGDIKVKSKLKQGTTFIVTLPLKHGEAAYPRLSEMNKVRDWVAEEAQVKTADAEVAENTGKPSVLIVEPSEDVAQYEAAQLKGDYQIYFASNGEHALMKTNELIPDLIITAVVMPTMDGFAFCKAVRSQEATCHIPIIMSSAKATTSDRLHGLQAGADDYIFKPFRADELRLRVTQLLAQRRLLRKKFAAEQGPAKPTQEAEAKSQKPDFLAELEQYVNEHIESGDIDLTQVAAHFGVTRPTLTRKVKQLTGLTTSAYIAERRVKKACQLLQTTNQSVAQVAAACGFSDTAYFILVFKRIMNKTPKQYKTEWASL